MSGVPTTRRGETFKYPNIDVTTTNLEKYLIHNKITWTDSEIKCTCKESERIMKYGARQKLYDIMRNRIQQ